MKAKFRIQVVLLMGLVLGPSLLKAQSSPIRALLPVSNAEVITLNQSVQRTLERNEDIHVAQETLNQQEIGALEAWALLMPTWTISGQKQFNDKMQSVEFHQKIS